MLTGRQPQTAAEMPAGLHLFATMHPSRHGACGMPFLHVLSQPLGRKVTPVVAQQGS